MMDEQFHARKLVQLLSKLERETLLGLMEGESVRGLAQRLSIEEIKAADTLDAVKWKLGVTRNADAVRIGLLAGLCSAD